MVHPAQNSTPSITETISSLLVMNVKSKLLDEVGKALQTSIGKETFAIQMLEQMEEKLSENAKQLDQSLKANLQLYEEHWANRYEKQLAKLLDSNDDVEEENARSDQFALLDNFVNVLQKEEENNSQNQKLSAMDVKIARCEKDIGEQDEKIRRIQNSGEDADVILRRNKSIIALASTWKERSKTEEQREITEIELQKLEKENKELHRKLEGTNASSLSVAQEMRMMNLSIDLERVGAMHSSPPQSPPPSDSTDDDESAMEDSSDVESPVQSAGRKRVVQQPVIASPRNKNHKKYAPRIVNEQVHNQTPVKRNLRGQTRATPSPKELKRTRLMILNNEDQSPSHLSEDDVGPSAVQSPDREKALGKKRVLMVDKPQRVIESPPQKKSYKIASPKIITEQVLHPKAQTPPPTTRTSPRLRFREARDKTPPSTPERSSSFPSPNATTAPIVLEKPRKEMPRQKRPSPRQAKLSPVQTRSSQRINKKPSPVSTKKTSHQKETPQQPIPEDDQPMDSSIDVINSSPSSPANDQRDQSLNLSLTNQSFTDEFETFGNVSRSPGANLRSPEGGADYNDGSFFGGGSTGGGGEENWF